jgi:hypothetical protein
MGPLQPATHTIPIVFVSGRPRCRRFRRPSLARQGGNATGFTSLEYAQTGKSLELLKEIAPKVERVAVIGLIAPLDSLPPQVRRNLMRGQPRFSVWVAFPFTLHSICLASGRGLPYQFRGLAGRCCSCLYSFPRSRGYRYIRRAEPRFRTFSDSLYARARVNVNLELSRSGNGVRNGFRRPDRRGSGQFAESALDTLYVARNRG